MVGAMQCPMCGGALAEGRPIDVCAACHKSLTGGVAVRATGEFLAATPQALEAALGIDDTGASGSRLVATTCSWCGKDATQVKKLLGRAGVSMCNECVALCADILDAELGTWR